MQGVEVNVTPNAIAVSRSILRRHRARDTRDHGLCWFSLSRLIHCLDILAFRGHELADAGRYGPFAVQDRLVLDSVQREEANPSYLKDHLMFLKRAWHCRGDWAWTWSKTYSLPAVLCLLGEKGLCTRIRG